jgi:Protein of unknown function (DUF3572)
LNKTTLKAKEAAEMLALRGLSFLLSKEEALMMFMQNAGLAPEDMRALASQKDFQAGVLDFFLSDETLLLEFAHEEGLKPESIARAARELGGGIWESEFA